MALVDSANGNTVVTYTYDAWGNVLSVGGSLATTLGAQNPFRYRGYVYDSETELYYLQSRYYNPEMGRFISADALVSTGQGILGNNMFAYCLNNPVMLEDHGGTEPTECIDTDGDGEADCYVYSYTYIDTFLWWSEIKTGYVYIYTGYSSGSEFENHPVPTDFNSTSDLAVAYFVSTDSDGKDNPVLYAYHAHKIKKSLRGSVIECFQMFDKDFSTPWERTDESLLTEWEGHHKYRLADSARNIDFDNSEEGKPIGYYDQKAQSRIIDIFKGIFHIS